MVFILEIGFQHLWQVITFHPLQVFTSPITDLSTELLHPESYFDVELACFICISICDNFKMSFTYLSIYDYIRCPSTFSLMLLTTHDWGWDHTMFSVFSARVFVQVQHWAIRLPTDAPCHSGPMAPRRPVFVPVFNNGYSRDLWLLHHKNPELNWLLRNTIESQVLPFISFDSPVSFVH